MALLVLVQFLPQNCTTFFLRMYVKTAPPSCSEFSPSSLFEGESSSIFYRWFPFINSQLSDCRLDVLQKIVIASNSFDATLETAVEQFDISGRLRSVAHTLEHVMGFTQRRQKQSLNFTKNIISYLQSRKKISSTSP